MPDIRIETVRTDSFSMDYFRFGKGKQTLVILPGLSVQSVTGSAAAVVQAYKPLTDDFTVWLFDRRNELPASYSVYDMARDTAEAFRVLGMEDICLFGASQGGMMAMSIAAGAPGLVKKLVLASTSPRITEEQFRAVGEWTAKAGAGNRKELYLAFGEAIYPKAIFEHSRDLLTAISETVTDEDLKRFVILADGLKGFDITDSLEKITCQVLIVGSADDRVLGAEASSLIAEKLKNSRHCELFMYDGCGHAVYDTAPDFKERMLRFLLRSDH